MSFKLTGAFMNNIEIIATAYLQNKMHKDQDDTAARNEFVSKYPVNDFAKMKKEEFVIGWKTHEGFCYKIEFGMRESGSMRGSSSIKFGLYYSHYEKKYVFADRWGNNDDEAFLNIKTAIINLFESAKRRNIEETTIEEIENNPLTNMFKFKLLYLYYPNITLPIYSNSHLDDFLSELGIVSPRKKRGMYRKIILLMDYKNKSEVLRKFTNLQFMGFLYYVFKTTPEFERKKEEIQNDAITKEIENLPTPIYTTYDKLENHQRERVSNRPTGAFNAEEDAQKRKKQKEAGNRAEEYVYINEKRKHPNKEVKLYSGKEDGIGYDIKSFDENDNEIHIEVKTKNDGGLDNVLFFLSETEYKIMQDDPCYVIFFVYDLNRGQPKIMIIKKNQLHNVTLQPTGYRIEAKAVQNQ